MVGTLLMRGMLVGIVAAILSFAFLKVAGEPAVDKAIAFETQMDEAKAKAKADETVASTKEPMASMKGMSMPAETDATDEELVSRPVQAGVGLLTGVTIYNVAFGGLFALVFALAYGRMGDFGPQTTSALLAVSGLVALYVVPNIKYPANPPSVGDPQTIGMRTGLYFSIMAISLAVMIAAWMLRGRLVRRFGEWDAALISVAAYVVVVVVVALVLPAVNEIPDGFPAPVLWQFRMASLGAQAIMWATIGLGFGAWMERTQISRTGLRLAPAHTSRS